MNKKFKNIIDNLYKSYNIVTASSEFERNVMVNDWGMLDDSVYIIGNARYDNLPTNEVAQTRDILYTPTWRDWIKFSSGKFTDTDYFKNIMNFLNDDKLNKILDEKDINVKIYMHHLMHEFIDDIKENITGKRIVFLDKGVTLANEIRKSVANITDYSSVAIDFLYMNRPILFYQFDLDEYMEKVDSYIDLKSEMFGSLAYNNDEAVNKLIDIIENNFEVMDNQKNERNKFFRYNDNKNCKRIYDCVLSKIK